MLGKKVLRFCPVKFRRVVCDGLCTVVFSVVAGPESFHICPVRERMLDELLNCSGEWIR